MTNQEKKQEEFLKKINDIPSMEGFKVPEGFPIALKNHCFVEVITTNTGETTTETGIIIPAAAQRHTIIPAMGVVVAVGPEAPEYLRPGLRVLHNPHIMEQILYRGKMYLRLHSEHDIYFIVPPEAFVTDGSKTSEQIRREDRRKGLENYSEKTAQA